METAGEGEVAVGSPNQARLEDCLDDKGAEPRATLQKEEVCAPLREDCCEQSWLD